MKFSDYKYERPIYEEVKKEFISIIDKINNSCTYEEQKENIKKLNILRNNVETMATLSSIMNLIPHIMENTHPNTLFLFRKIHLKYLCYVL